MLQIQWLLHLPLESRMAADVTDPVVNHIIMLLESHIAADVTDSVVITVICY